MNCKKDKINASKLVSKLKKYNGFDKLDTAMLQDLIQRIEIHKRFTVNGVKQQPIDIYLKGAEHLNIAALDFSYITTPHKTALKSS